MALAQAARAQSVAADPRLIVARTFSKVFGLAGLRVGYAIGQKETFAYFPQSGPLPSPCRHGLGR